MLTVISSKIAIREAPLQDLIGEMNEVASPARGLSYKLRDVFRQQPGRLRSGTEPRACSLCGTPLPRGGILDTTGASGQINSWLCPTHARQCGIVA